MGSPRWVEVNIRLRDVARQNEVLLDFVNGFVQGHRDKFKVWHFLREKSPVTGEPEIRLRFFGEEKDIRSVQQDLDWELRLLETSKGNVYSSHAFGGHGDPNKIYEGEEDGFGKNGWEIFADFLMKTSEVAISFLRKEPLGKSEKDWTFYMERFSHCFWNQLGVPPHVKFQAVGPEVFSGLFEWLDYFAQAIRLPR